jgi:hypothetical protein
MKLKFIIVVVLFVFTSYVNKLYSQAHLSFGYSGVIHEDTVSYGDSVLFSFWIVNTGNAPLNDSIQLSCETYNTSGLIMSGSFGMFSTPSGILNSGDSMFFNVYDIITPQSYSVGDNIVVIWPASIIPVTVDTSYTPLHVLSNIVLTNDVYSSIEFFPNPVESLLNVRSNDKIINALYIMDMYGRVIIREENLNCRNHVIQRKNMLSGLYLLIIRSEEEEFITKVIIK